MPKLAIFMLLGVGLLSPKEHAVVAFDQSPLSLTIRALNDHARIGEPIRIEANITNTSSAPVAIPNRNADIDYLFTVRDPHNVAPPETERLKRAKDTSKPPFIFGASLETLKPNESRQEKFAITDYYEFVDPGEYSIQVSRQAGRHKADVVTSNMITVTLTPKESDAASETKSTGTPPPSMP